MSNAYSWAFFLENILRQREDRRYILILICSYDIFKSLWNKRKIKKKILGSLQRIKFLRKKIRKIQEKKKLFQIKKIFSDFFKVLITIFLKYPPFSIFKIHNRSREIFDFTTKNQFLPNVEQFYKVSFCKMIISVYSLIAKIYFLLNQVCSIQ